MAGVDGTLTDCNPAFARMLGYDSVPEAVHGGALAIFGGDVSWRGFVGGVAREVRFDPELFDYGKNKLDKAALRNI